MYGVYSFVNADRISLTVNVVNNERNEQRSFAAIGCCKKRRGANF